ncbi:MAG: 50S ribosomal protein L19 [Chloroflexi bacterium]|nr:50S ribosomal protein L19 [Chloroflexota bacterium]
MDIKSIIELKVRPEIPQFGPGDTVKASVKVVEGDRERIQAFQGIVIRVKRGDVNATFTVRRISSGVGVERTFFFQSPRLEKVEVVRKGKVRRANLYYLRGLSGRAGRIKERTRELPAELRVEAPAEMKEEAPPVAAPSVEQPQTSA